MALAVCIIAAAGHLAATELIKGGKPLAVLVTPDEPSAEVRSAAELLQQTLAKMSGARLAIVAESAGAGTLVPIHVGHTKYTMDRRVRRYIARLEDLTERFAVQEGRRSPSDVDAILQRLDNVVDEKPVTAPRSTLPSGWHVVWTDSAMAELQQLLDAAAKAVPAQTVEGRRVAILREGFEFARLELPVRRATEDYIDQPSPENDYKFVHAVACVEQWMYANQNSKAIGVVDGYSWWWRKMRIDPITRGRIFGHATKLADGNYTLTIPAYNDTGKFAAIQFSRDGRTWLPEEPYTLEHPWKSARGDTAVYARLVLTNSKGRRLMDPIKIDLQ